MIPKSILVNKAATGGCCSSPSAAVDTPPTNPGGWCGKFQMAAATATTTTVSELDDEIVLMQQHRILELQKKVDALAADKSNLEGSVRDLREKNVSLAKKLARCSRMCRFARRRSSDALSSSSLDDADGGDKSDGSGGDAAAVDALEWLVRKKDEQLHDLACRSKASEEMIAILRGQLTALLREKCDVEKNLRRDVDRAERKNAALKGSVEACDSTIESLRDEVDEMRATADERARKAEDERDALRREFEAERKDAKETISKLRERLGEASREELQTSLAVDTPYTSTEHRSSAAMTATETPTELPPLATLQAAGDELKKEREASQKRAAGLQKQLCAMEEKLKQSNDENSVLHESNCACKDFGIYYEPVVKNLTFLLEMRDQTVKKIKTERDEALEEAERYRRQNERLSEGDVTMAENLLKLAPSPLPFAGKILISKSSALEFRGWKPRLQNGRFHN